MSTHHIEIGDKSPRIGLTVGRPKDCEHVLFDPHGISRDRYGRLMKPWSDASNITVGQAVQIIDALIEAFPGLGYVKWPSLLDAIRSTTVAAGERGGITQQELFSASKMLANKFRNWERLDRATVKRFLDALEGAS